jgi:hypothetical protein
MLQIRTNPKDFNELRRILQQLNVWLGSAIDDAPSDGKSYVRKNGAWVEGNYLVLEDDVVATPYYLLLESGDSLLLESGDKLILEA